jgi:hypothetical protein
MSELRTHPADLTLSPEVVGHQRFLFVRLPPSGVDGALADALDGLGQGMENMHDVAGHPSADALQRGRFQFLRAEPTLSAARDLPHPAILSAHALIRLEGTMLDPLLRYEEGVRKLIAPGGGTVETLAGVQRPRSYTSYAMTQFAYAPALAPQPGAACPIGVVTPQNKTAAWWAMDWMQRESFFLPRYDAQARLVAKGHALAAAVGIPYIVRRNVHAPEHYGREGDYDFVPYFEFAEEHAPIFRAVMAALRDTAQNPEWAYVREGPEWWGRRVGSAAALWENRPGLQDLTE